MKRILSVLLVLTLVLSSCLAETAEPAPAAKELLSAETVQTPGGDVLVYVQDSLVFVDGDCTGEPVRSAEDAAGALQWVSGLMGSDERVHFEPWNVVNDPFGNVYYIFQQTYADLIVLGGAVKVITDAQGQVLGLTGSVVTDLPEAGEAEGLSLEAAEQLVLQHESEKPEGSGQLISGMSQRAVLPVNRVLDLEADEIETRFVWTVYTTNPSASVGGTDLPYLAHYVSMAGEYLYCMPTILPGDAAGSAGYDAEYVFQFMEPAEYTGYVDWSDGSEHEISVTLMRDTRTGMYYLGNIEHKIVVADCYEFLYNGGNVVLEYSADNMEWDQVGLMSLYNYCRVYDYYREIGWEGGDGAGTPIIVLKDFCDPNHRPVDNAAYAGKIYGWQCFLSSSINDYAQTLDVCAHEFTHCVTGTVMTYNAYQNDYGAINEAMSDIQGNICEMLYKATDDTAWTLGENSARPVRSMSEPHKYSQPEYTWDLFYQAHVKTPTAMNDLGGVHTNSSILNYLAWQLCEEGGLSLEDARAFWFAVDCAMVPATDYLQLRVLLPWMMRISGLGAQEALARAIDATRLGDDSLPETVSADQAMLVLNLPDNEVFSDGNWALNILSLDVDTIMARIAETAGRVQAGDTEGLPVLVQEMFKSGETAEESKASEPEEPKGFWGVFLEELLKSLPGEEETEPAPQVDEGQRQEARDWLQKIFLKDVFYSGMASAGEDGHTVRTVIRPGRAVPMLLYMRQMPESDQLEQAKVVIYINGHWVDVTELMSSLKPDAPDPGSALSVLFDSGLAADILDVLFSGDGLEGMLNGFTFRVPAGQVTELPAAGLESVTMASSVDMNIDTTPVVQNRKSRPKLTEGEE